MSNSLQDQLLKSGLISEAKLEEWERKKHKPTGPRKPKSGKQKSKNRRGAPVSHNNQVAKATSPPAPAAPQVAPSPAAPATEDAASKAQQGKLLRRKIKEVLRANQLNDSAAEISYYFQHNKLVKRIYLNAEQHKLMLDGQLVIVPFGEKHFVVSENLCTQLQEMEPAITVIRHDPDTGQDESDHPVPDDLMW